LHPYPSLSKRIFTLKPKWSLYVDEAANVAVVLVWATRLDSQDGVALKILGAQK